MQMNLTEVDPGFTQAQLAMVDVSDVLAEERDREIRKIVETITELAQVRGVGGWGRGRLCYRIGTRGRHSAGPVKSIWGAWSLGMGTSDVLVDERDRENRKIVETVTELAQVRGVGGLGRLAEKRDWEICKIVKT